MKVYVSGCRKQDADAVKHNGCLSVSLSSSVVLFVLNYCKTNDFHLVIVDDDGSEDKVWVPAKLECLQNLQYSFMNHEDVPLKVASCVLPVIEDPNDLMLRCGLCSVVRHIIKVSHRGQIGEHLIDLLGFRAASLKACAEVSGWTKLCEVELPNAISQLIRKFRQDCELTSVEIPDDVMKLELHFDKPPILHNDDKPKRIILKAVQAEFESYKDGTNSETDVNKFFANREEDMPHGKVRYRVISKDEKEAKKFDNSENGEKCRFGCSENRLVKWCAKCNDRERLKRKEEAQERNFARLVETRNGEQSDGKSNNSTMPNGISSVGTNSDDRNVMDELCNYVSGLTIQDIVYDHLFTEGVYFTVADIMLFVYIYHLSETLQSSCSNLLQKLPNIKKWLSNVLTLKKLPNIAVGCGFDLHGLKSAVNSTSCCLDGPDFIIPTAPLIVQEYGNEISRGAKAQQKALKKELARVLMKIKEQGITPTVGCHPYGAEIHVDWKSVPLAAHPKIELPEKRVGRKCEQLENLAMAVKSIAKPGDVIVDFCSGAGHLGIVIAYLLPDCQVYMIDNKEESLTRANDRVKQLSLDNVTLYQCNLDYFQGQFDIGVCLHACGVATDLVLQQCLDRKASFVICPCCYGNIRNTHLLSYPRSQYYREAGFNDKDVVILGHAADQTEENTDFQQQGRHCMNLVDTDRARLAEECGYSVTLCSLQPLSCTPKNNLLIGTKTRL